jgi:hypothetical protein
MWDGRQSTPGHIRDGRISQASAAVTSRAQGAPPTPAVVHSLVDFELGLFSTQVVDRAAGNLADAPHAAGPALWPASRSARHQRSAHQS